MLPQATNPHLNTYPPHQQTDSKLQTNHRNQPWRVFGNVWQSPAQNKMSRKHKTRSAAYANIIQYLFSERLRRILNVSQQYYDHI